MARRVTEGSPEPLGASATSDGVNFAVHAPEASVVELCLFDAEGETETARLVLPARTGPVFHGHVGGLRTGARYGLRAHGAFDPARGLRFNPNKLLLDPYALSIDRPFALRPSMFGYGSGPPDAAAFDAVDSAPDMPKAVVVDLQAPASARPARPWGETVIYELHVRGFTHGLPGVPKRLRGTFAGLGHPTTVAYLKQLGVTAVELLPCMAWIDERHLPALGLSNYWGYNPVALMAPDPRLAPGGWAEVRAATDALAAAGIETILDVVLNHSGESDALGPTVSLRGLDNAGYYRLDPKDPAAYVNDAGTGNVLALDNPAALRLAMDALRTWRAQGGMAGFRFDLASVLGRRAQGFDPHAPLLSALAQDPDLRSLKLIAEPWDLGPGGYQLGRFPPAWGEWNDRFRDDVRGFWRGDGVSLGALAQRLAGSQDLFATKPPSRGVNFVVAHDGFTLADLVSYAAKHNQANGEDNRDGTDDNRSWNDGVEGPSDDAVVTAARLGDQRTLLATLLLSRGTPMLAMGGELGHSQGGNNNAYCQDNPLSWIDWAKADAGLAEFTRRLIAARRAHPALRADRFLTGEPDERRRFADVEWRRADGARLAAADWDDPRGESLVMVLSEPDGEGCDRVVVVIHRGGAPVSVALPAPRDGFGWGLVADSADPARSGLLEGDGLTVAARSVTLLAETPAPGRRPRTAEPETLASLAEAAGVSADWWGVDGGRRIVNADTQRALLAAMRLPAASQAQALSSLRVLAETFDRPRLPPIMTIKAGAAARVPLCFSPGEPAPDTWLVLDAEDGPTLRLPVSTRTCDEVAVEGRDGRRTRALVVETPALRAGRYTLRREDRPDARGLLTAAPTTCHHPSALDEGRRVFGLSTQLYALARDGDQGVGDFTTLGLLGQAAASQGAASVGLNPLHALFPDRRDRASPYYPSDRRFLDPIYLDLASITAGVPAVAPGGPMIDYGAVWSLKAKALEQAFAARPPTDPAFEAFIAEGGQALERFAVFQAISETHAGVPWPRWPVELRDPASAAVGAFATAHAQRVRFQQWLQWLCDTQFADAARRASGLELGFCRDLAVGAAPDGAEAWAGREILAKGACIGAPPDPLGPLGQNWGLPPFDPHQLALEGYETVRALFRANMRHAGVLRIDHVMGLARQFWIPDGADGAQGAYVTFPLRGLLGELALESRGASCLVVGEDLGTVPEGLRETLAQASVLSYRVLPFERDGAAFKPPEAYPRLALACVATHDLPTLVGWWDGVDIDERLGLGLIAAGAADAARAERLADKAALVEALTLADRLPAGASAEARLDDELAAALHGFVADTPSLLALAQLEDLTGEPTAINLPGTDQERPNWRRRLGTPLEALFASGRARAILEVLRAARGPQSEIG